MIKTIGTVAAVTAVAAVSFLIGNVTKEGEHVAGDSATPGPTPTVYRTVNLPVPGPTSYKTLTVGPTPPERTVTIAGPAPAAPEADTSTEDYDTTALALEVMWASRSASDKADMCVMWNLDKDAALAAFNSGNGGSMNQQAVNDFFRKEC